VIRRALGVFAGRVGRGLFAGLVGTAAMTLSSTLEAKLRGRQPSSAPSDAAGKLLQVQPRNPVGRKRFSNVVHWTYGLAWGGVRGAMASVGLGGIRGTAAHFATVWGSGLVVLPKLEVAPPPKEWGTTELAIDALHHVVYAAVTGLAFAWLDGAEPDRRR
jgi:hypothetical protein